MCGFKGRAIQAVYIAEDMLKKYPEGFTNADVVREYFHIPMYRKIQYANFILDIAADIAEREGIKYERYKEGWGAWQDENGEWFAPVWIKGIRFQREKEMRR